MTSLFARSHLAPPLLHEFGNPNAAPWSAPFMAALLARRWGADLPSGFNLGAPCLNPAAVEWGRCEPLLYEASQGLELDPRLISFWRERYLYTAVRNRINAGELTQVLSYLRAGDPSLDVMVLKGMILSINLYRNLALRPVQDIDLLVAPQDARTCVNKIEQLGYRRFSKEQRPGLAYAFENEAGFAKASPPHTLVDIHWRLFDSPHHQHHIDQAWLWDTANWVDAEGLTFRMLCPEAQVLHLCGHLAFQHPVPIDGDVAPVLLWLVDIGEVIHRYGAIIDWATVLAKAQEFDLVLPLQSVLGHVRALWPFLLPDELWTRIEGLQPTEVEQRVYQCLAAEDLPELRRFINDLGMMPTWSMRVRYTAQRVFPSAEYMQWRYDIGSRWTVPAYYPYRWWVGLSGLWKERQ